VTTTKTAIKTEVPELAQKIREQLVATVQQGQQFSVDAVETFVKAVSVLPVPDLPTFPGTPALPSFEAATKYTFDVVGDLLNAQREYALQLAKVLVPAKSV
jgi:hypothetical protein